MRSRSRRGWNSSVLYAVVLPRFLGALIPVFMYLQANGYRVDVGALQARAFSGALGFLMLYTRTGRRIAFAGWLFIVVVIVLNLGGEVERAREAFELLLWWLALGALWFVDWRRVTGMVNRSKPAWTRTRVGMCSARVRRYRAGPARRGLGRHIPGRNLSPAT